MDKEKIYGLIDEYVLGIEKINNNFDGIDRIKTHEKEQRNYIHQFREAGINPNIVSAIYTEVALSSNKDGIQRIKDTIEERVLK